MRNQSNASGQLGSTLAVLLTLSLCLCSAAQAAPFDLEAQMTPAEYRAAGLEQLTDAQRAALSAWLDKHAVPVGLSNKHAAVEPKAVAREKSRRVAGFGGEQVEKKAAAVPEVVQAQIAGEFRGWDGKTLFRLTNGQIWQQRVGGRYRYRAVDPEVNIQRARFGYYLEIKATGRKIGVKRVK